LEVGGNEGWVKLIISNTVCIFHVSLFLYKTLTVLQVHLVSFEAKPRCINYNNSSLFYLSQDPRDLKQFAIIKRNDKGQIKNIKKKKSFEIKALILLM
jgi:hypothetical protein